jgi:hypothetical protein
MENAYEEFEPLEEYKGKVSNQGLLIYRTIDKTSILLHTKASPHKVAKNLSLLVTGSYGSRRCDSSLRVSPLQPAGCTDPLYARGDGRKL